jgi:hypothetical protein
MQRGVDLYKWFSNATDDDHDTTTPPAHGLMAPSDLTDKLKGLAHGLAAGECVDERRGSQCEYSPDFGLHMCMYVHVFLWNIISMLCVYIYACIYNMYI